jgi:exodeoxyribonuclease VII large subunit
MELKPKNVSQIVGEIKHLLETEFKDVYMEGEVTNLSLSSSGHWYFTLSDKDSSMSAALFKMDAFRNPQIKTIKDGAKVVITGDINVYPKRGTFQVIVKKIVPIGVGDLKEQFEKLKIKLRAEGLFDLEHKKSIPELPKRVAIITALRGAALQDFLNIYKRRSLWMDVLVVPALVQGDDAPRALRLALHNTIKFSLEASTDKKIDVIVLARGGGSLEDLWAFNDEGLAFDIFNCPIPLISAIGHEVDFSISDFVSDLRAETPSAAAELLTHKQTLIKEKMVGLKRRMISSVELKESRFRSRLKMSHPKEILNEIQTLFIQLQKRLQRLRIDNRLNELTHIADYYQNLDYSLEAAIRAIKQKIERFSMRIEQKNSILAVTNPKNVLQRGYSFIELKDKNIVLSAKAFDKIKIEEKLSIHFHDGKRTVIKSE